MSESSDAPDGQPQLEACKHCGTLLDVGDQAPFDKIHCPSCGGAMHVKRKFNHYELEAIMGQGGMGTVYKAKDLNLNRMVAIKLLKREYGEDSGSIEELEREAKITASISHPNVVKIYSFNQAHGQYYFAMELVEKGSLDDLMGVQERVAEVQVLKFGMQIAAGLKAAFERGLVHSDIKPGNILFADAHTAKIVDFGLAILMEQQAEKDGEIWGTPYYVSPERLNKETEDFRSDIYSLGGTLFHALAGRPPFEAETASLVALKHLKSKAVSLQAFAPEVSSETAYVINRMLKKDPDERYGSYDELIEHLTYAHNQLVENSGIPSKRRRAQVVVEDERSKKVSGLLSLGLIATIVVILGIVFFYWQNSQQETEVVRPTKARPAATVTQSSGNAEDEAARKLVLVGDVANAQTKLRALREDTFVPQPLENWMKVHEAMAARLNDQPTVSSQLYRSIIKDGLYSMDPAELEKAKFFVSLGEVLKEDDPVGNSEATTFANDNYEAISFLLFGIHNWKLGELSLAASMFDKYLNSQPAPGYEWILDYKQIAAGYLEDFRAMSNLRSEAEKATTKIDLNRVRTKMTRARDRTTSGKELVETYDELIQKVDTKIANVDRVKVKPTKPQSTQKTKPQIEAEKRAEDEQDLAKLESRLQSSLKDFDFAGALKAIQDFKPRLPESEAKAKALLAKAQGLVNFQNTLINDINMLGYPNALPLKRGKSTDGKIAQADANGFKVQLKYGTMPLKWQDISSKGYLDMANYFAKENSSRVSTVDRTWYAGVFFYLRGDQERGKQFMKIAGNSKPEYAELFELIMGG